MQMRPHVVISGLMGAGKVHCLTTLITLSTLMSLITAVLPSAVLPYSASQPCRLSSASCAAMFDPVVLLLQSTLSRRLAQLLDVPYFPEPVEANPYLGRFYEDPSQWAPIMEVVFLCAGF